MGILHDEVMRLKGERAELETKLEFFNVRSPGRDRLLRKKREVDREITNLSKCKPRDA